MSDEYQEPSLWDELVNEYLDEDREREIAVPKWNVPPGHYDDCDYHYEDEESFGLEAFNQELAAIRRLRQAQLEKRKKQEQDE